MTALRTTTFALSFALLTAASALAGPPLITDDAGTVEVGKVEIELNGQYTHNSETVADVTTKADRHETEMKITTGLYKDLGISLALPYTSSARENVGGDVNRVDGFGDMTLEVKYAFAELAGINFAVKPSIIMPTGNYSNGLSEGRWQFGTTLIATSEFADGKYAVHANLGYEHHSYRDDAVRDTTRGDFWSGSLAGEMKIMQGLTVVANFGLATNPDKASHELPVYALTGVRYEINDHLDIDAGVKLGLTKPEDDVSILYGLVLKF